jgi:hypothetical protein
VSSARTYHALALIRSLLGIDDVPSVKVNATAAHAPLIGSPRALRLDR